MSEGSWFETLDSEVRFKGFSTVRVDTLRLPDGNEVEREVVEHVDAVAMVPVTDDGDVVLLRQYRHPVGRYLLEIPAGILDVEGESREEAAERELREETGLSCERLEELIVFQNSAGWSDEQTTIYLATGLSHGEAPEGFEPVAEEADMEVVKLPLDEAVAAVRAGRITDAKTCIGLLLVAAV